MMIEQKNIKEVLKMTRSYSMDLLEKLRDDTSTVDYKGVTVLLKSIPDNAETGAMDTRLYDGMKKTLRIIKFMPKSMMKMDTSPKGIIKLRKMFNEVKSKSIIDGGVKRTLKTVSAIDGYEIPIRIYEPEGNIKNLPILYYIHGGGFFGGSSDVVQDAIEYIVKHFEICAVSVDYRLAPEHPYPAQHEDCYQVLQWIGQNAEDFHGDKNNIFVGGDSAGGNLAQYCSTKNYEEGHNLVKGQLLLYPTVNFAGIEDEYFHWSKDEYEISPKYKTGINMMLDMFSGLTGGLQSILGEKADPNSIYLNPYIRNPENNPPTFITVGEHDYLKVESLAYAAKLTKANVDVKTVVYKGLGHAYIDNIGFYPQSEDCAIEMGKFIMEHTS